MMPLNVFYLDDEPDLLESFKDSFETNCVKVTTFQKPEDCLSAIQKKSPDLLFLDFRLPGSTGDELAREISDSIPKVLVTGDLSVETKAHFVAVVHKPFNHGLVESIIDRYLREC